MLKLTYLPDSSKTEEIFQRLLNGLKDDNGNFIQKGMPTGIFFDKRQTVAPYKSGFYSEVDGNRILLGGHVFKVTSSGTGYYVKVSEQDGLFQEGEQVTITQVDNFFENTSDDSPVSQMEDSTKTFEQRGRTGLVDYKATIFDDAEEEGSKVIARVKYITLNDFLVLDNPDSALTVDFEGATIKGLTSKTTATIKSLSFQVTEGNPHTLSVYLTGEYQKPIQPLFEKHFVPTATDTYLSNVRLGKGWNSIYIRNDLTGEESYIILNVRYYATIINGISEEIAEYIQLPIDQEQAAIFNYLSTHLCEMYLRYMQWMTNIETLQRLGLILSIKSLVSFSGSNLAADSMALALFSNTPVITEQQVEPYVYPALYEMYKYQQDFAGVDFNIWIRNRQIIKWMSFIKYIQSVPFYEFNSISENTISIYRVTPFLTRRILIEVNPVYFCDVCGYSSRTRFTVCPEHPITLGQSVTEVYINFTNGETITFVDTNTADDLNLNGITAVVEKVGNKYLHLKDLNIQSTTIGIGQYNNLFDSSYILSETVSITGGTSNANASVTGSAIDYFDWNTPVPVGSMGDTCFNKQLEIHEFDFNSLPLNDEWKFNCWDGVVATSAIQAYLYFANCAAFTPYFTAVNLLLSYEPTVEEEEILRVTWLNIEDYWGTQGSSSSSSKEPQYDKITFSRHSDYGTETGNEIGLYNKYVLSSISAMLPVYQDLTYASPVYSGVYVEPNEIVRSTDFFNLLKYNDRGNRVLTIIKKGILGYIEVEPTMWFVADSWRYGGKEPIPIFSSPGSAFNLGIYVNVGEIVTVYTDIETDLPNSEIYDGIIYYEIITFDSIHGWVASTDLIKTEDGIGIPRSVVRRQSWVVDLPVDPETYLPNLSYCSGFEANVLDQVVYWNTNEAPISDEFSSFLYVN